MWIIDKETVTEGTDLPTRVGWTSPAFDPSRELPFKFRMKDGDGEVYYEGRSDEEDFDPLDDLGTPDAGCTSIEYLQPNGEWQEL